MNPDFFLTFNTRAEDEKRDEKKDAEEVANHEIESRTG